MCHLFFTLVLTVLWQPGMAPYWEEGLGREEAGQVAVTSARQDVIMTVFVSSQFEQENQRLIGEMNNLFDEVRYVCGSCGS